MNKLILGRYFPGNSLLHQMDPRAKLVAGFYFILVLFLANNWQTLLLLWAFTIGVMYLSGVRLRTYLRGVRPLIWLILFAVFLQVLFTSGGTVYIDWGPITVSQMGVINGMFVFSRFVMIIFVSTVITLTTKPIDLTDGIDVLLGPLRKLKIPVDDLSLMLSISLRFIPNLLDETQRVMDAQRARGTEFGEGSILNQIKKIVPLFVPLYVSSLNRAEEIANVLEVKGYRPGEPRSSFRKLKWKTVDTLALCLIIVLTIGLLSLRTV